MMTVCDCCQRSYFTVDGGRACAYCIMDSIGAAGAGMAHTPASHSVPVERIGLGAVRASAWRTRALAGDNAGARDLTGAVHA